MSTKISDKQRYRGSGGFTPLEILVIVVLVASATGAVFLFNHLTTGSAERISKVIIAGELIERQIEQMRTEVETDSLKFWPPADGQLTDNPSGITIEWKVFPEADPTGSPIDRSRKVEYSATWQAAEPETLTVETILSKDL